MLLFVIVLTVLTHLHNPAAAVARAVHALVPQQVPRDTDAMSPMFFSTSGCDRLILASSLPPEEAQTRPAPKPATLILA